MRKITLIIAVLVMFLTLSSGAWGGTYYVDKRCTYNGNGTAATCAAGAGQAGAFKALTDACDASKTGAGNRTINIVAGSGPYLTSDCQFLAQGHIYSNHPGGTTTTWNFNGNTLRMDVNLNDGTYEWHQSGAAGKTTWYYVTAAGGANPSLIDPKSVVVDGDWNAESVNLVSGAASYLPNNWAYGNYDTLGFNTVYVHLAGDIDPTGTGKEIWAAQHNKVIETANTFATHIFNDGIFRGSTTRIVLAYAPIHMYRCSLYNADQEGVLVNNTFAAGSTFNYCIFDRAGHRGISNWVQGNLTAYNCLFKYVHLAVKSDSNTAYTITLKNNATYNLYAGGIQLDVAAPTLVESNNQWHLDPQSTHGGKAIAFTAGVRQWVTTAASDIPANTATTNAVGVVPGVDSDGRAVAGSLLIEAGTDVSLTTDFVSKAVPRGTNPTIGAFEYYPRGTAMMAGF